MAIAVVGGLLTSTALSLFVVPVTFVIVAEVESAIRRRLSALFIEREQTDAATF
jgi:hypothetical protein